MDLAEKILQKDKRAVARLITLIERENLEAREALKKLYKYTGNSFVIGITGPPGAGKSSLVNELAKKIREKGKTVGIIAVDPTSPFTGGALLGDRIRMQDLTLDEGIFIRSMGSRGSLGGITKAAYDAVKVLDAYGMDYVIIETVGVGQTEIDIVKLADTVVLVLVPGLGDDVQAIKAGIMEIADIFAVNKSDREGADRLVHEIEMMMELSQKDFDFRPPIVKTVAVTGEGIDVLECRISEHLDYLCKNGILEQKRKTRVKEEFMELLKEHITRLILQKNESKIDMLVRDISNRTVDPYTALDILTKEIF
ncbi:methylmalonyl Co-A mutase-associated GTPase MeaB [Thermosediminibacter oceani]|uniref:LAO/AO transport system ATPase n=1 Tax=Thermosediminibacter oceani (strain ATCC BAA-1034 / DSM 16646 / JW/IW-1228P) TaxID=555079 RepID=D9S3H9_THEOJ|nr:methylmalonyl Co-A mutase-associated GTPase MeaB [Thermosediminibacter oceani]ADL07956.1 LAO/AO transport system ATPase [Thermosediminibacter oceani DSM 16646]